jgi:hypothetical protein
LCASVQCIWSVLGPPHHIPQLLVRDEECLGFIGQLALDVRSTEDGLQVHPRLLYIHPGLQRLAEQAEGDFNALHLQDTCGAWLTRGASTTGHRQCKAHQRSNNCRAQAVQSSPEVTQVQRGYHDTNHPCTVSSRWLAPQRLMHTVSSHWLTPQRLMHTVPSCWLTPQRLMHTVSSHWLTPND